MTKVSRAPGTWRIGQRLRINFVGAEPIAKGSMKAWVPKGSKFAKVSDSNAATLKIFERDIRLIATTEMDRAQLPCSMRQAFAITAVFFMPRAGSHFTSGPLPKLRDDAPAYPNTKPDFDKLTRAACDAFTGIVWDDDSRIVRATIEERFASAKRDVGIYFEVRALPATVRELRDLEQQQKQTTLGGIL